MKSETPLPRAASAPPDGPVTVSTGGSATGTDDLLRSVAAAQDQPPESSGPLASGGMGVIDVIHDPVLRRRSARKRVHPHLQDDTETLRRFVREAQVTGQLDHPNIVPVRQLAVDDQGQLYFTMKLVGGRTLSEILRGLPHPLEHNDLFEVLDVVVKVCDALAFAHSRGVIHCDIKPANIMVGEFGEVYLMDWGVAIVRSERLGAAEVLPRSEGEESPTLAGTPTHMAPEQARGHTDAIDERSDVFAVGALIYQALTRRSPFYGDTFWASVLRAQMGAYTPIDEMVGTGRVPRSLVALVDRAMAHEQHERFQDVRALKEAILQFVRGGAPFPSRPFRAGDAIVSEGEMGNKAYRIRSGTCVVTKGDTLIRRMEAGEVFGEMAILSPGPRTATVCAETDVVCEVLTAEVFERELDAMKPWMSAFVRTLADRFRESGR
ncbi:MAG: cyclic nucleotide-binding domain-containing protein [Myxococcota bacterium]